MTQQNPVLFQISEGDSRDVKAAIATLKAKLLPNLKTLTAADRNEMLETGGDPFEFIKKGEYCKTHLLFPSFSDSKALGAAIKAIELIRSFYRPLSQIVKALDDTMILSVIVTYAGILKFCDSFKTDGAKN